jgi:predicted nuclease with TOPRIM domain
LKELTTKRVAEAEEADRNAKLEALVEMQSQKIAEIEVACADLKQEKENLTAGYRRLLEKHKALIEEAEREKTKLVEAQATELAGIKGEMDKETQDYTDYCIDVRPRLCVLHKVVASSFDACPSQPEMQRSRI